MIFPDHYDEPPDVRWRWRRKCQDDEFRQEPRKNDLRMNNKKVTFDKVAGLQEEKEDLVEVVDFLKSTEIYKSRRKNPERCDACRTSRNR